MSVTEIPDVLTVSEAARKANVSKSTIRREIASGNLTPWRCGRVLRVMDEELARWIRSKQAA